MALCMERGTPRYPFVNVMGTSYLNKMFMSSFRTMPPLSFSNYAALMLDIGYDVIYNVFVMELAGAPRLPWLTP